MYALFTDALTVLYPLAAGDSVVHGADSVANEIK
jgi:hypothetical protein